MDTVINFSKEFAGKRLYDLLLTKGIPFFAPCGGKGTCGKCRVKLLDGGVLDRDGMPLLPDEKGEVLSCHAFVSDEGCTVAIPALSGKGLTLTASVSKTKPSRLGIALDVGTTTLAAALVDLDSQKAIRTASALNPQAPFGADVMSRILACREGNLRLLHEALIKAVFALCHELLGKERAERMIVVGNPTMLHLFLGISPEGIGQYPFKAAFLDTQYRKGEELSLPCEEIVVLPSASAFIGSDVLAGVYLYGLADRKEASILIDVGTNGEIVLVKDRVLFAASCAAGPALEGAKISSGLGGVSGAVSSVRKKEGKYCYTTVGDAPPRGICGAGLCDLVALLLDDEVLDGSGYLDETYRLCGCHETKEGRLPEAPSEITLTAGDIRELQLAKAAIRAGLDTLIKEASLSQEELSSLLLAGGLGYYLSPDSACRIGMFSETMRQKIKAVGNSALEGAIKALCEKDAVSTIETIAKRIKTIELNESAYFAECFMNGMLFDEL